ncbi:MAG: YraN family protein [Coriobacteriales bacterium]|jgi:putative endonuclease|nr:YraN family protein [Coriobacteriales bacterium]
MSDSNRQVGAKGEEFAARYLEREGVEVVERNWSCKAGEADIIARDDDALVFVEVKTRRSMQTGFPEEAVTQAKRRRYEKIAAYYLSQKQTASTRVRFDVISIMLTGEQQAFLKHHRDVFACGE